MCGRGNVSQAETKVAKTKNPESMRCIKLALGARKASLSQALNPGIRYTECRYV